MKTDNGDRADVNRSGASEPRRGARKPSGQNFRAKPRGKSVRGASGEPSGQPERYASKKLHSQTGRNKSGELHSQTVRNKPSELHSQTGRNKPNELHGQTGRNKSSELHSQTGRNKSNKLYSQTGRNKSSELHSQTGRNKPSELHSQTGRNKPSELHSQTGRNKPNELHSQTGRRAAQNRLPKTRIAAELPRGKTELYSVESDVSDLSDVFEIRQYVVGEDRSEKLLSLLGFAARARRLVFGTELCRTAARAGQISLVVIAADASPNTKKRVVDACKYYGCDVCQSAVPSSILASRLGKSGVTAVVGLSDHNFIAGITALCARQTLDI